MLLQRRPGSQVLTKKEILAAVVSRLEKGSEEEEDQKNPNELQGEEQNLNFMSIVIVIVKEMYQGQYLMAMAGARAVVAQGRLAGHDHHHPLEEEKLVTGAEVVAGVAGSEERLLVAEMVGVDHRPLIGLDVLDVQLWILGAKLNKRYRLQLFF